MAQCGAPGLITTHQPATVEEKIVKCNREGDHTGLHSNGQYDWGPGDVLDAQARMVWGCPTCGEESFDPDTKEVTGGLKITCPDCGADIFQPDAGWPGPPSET